MSAVVDQAMALRAMVKPAEIRGQHRARMVAVSSGKGGVGKSNVAVNLAVRLAMMGRRVVLVDADLGTANADVLCDVNPTYNLTQVLSGQRRLTEIALETSWGFRLVPGASGLMHAAALNEYDRAQLLEQLAQLEFNSDLVLIDTGAGIGPNVLSFATHADEVLVVTTPEPTALTDAYALIKCIHRQRQDAVVRVLVNMSRDLNEAQLIYKRLEAACWRFLSLRIQSAGHLLMDQKVYASVRQRKPFVALYPSCDASRGISQLAHRMDRHTDVPRGESLLSRLAAWWSNAHAS